MSKKILLVDNKDRFIEQCQPKLEARGYSVETASSYNEALKKFEAFSPDVVITALMLEHFDSGFVLAHKMKLKNPGLVLLIVTNATHLTGIKFSLNTHEERDWIKADGFLNEPIRENDLIDIMESALERKKKKTAALAK